MSFFLNFGYVANLNPQCAAVAVPAATPNKNSVRLVLEVLEDCVTSGSRVLDVGCGRGGTVWVMRRFLAVERVVGVDLSGAAISFCRRAHGTAGVRFLHSDAERLPFQGDAFDVITNIESSNCYPDLFAFYSEVHRTLAPGGRFLYTDCLPAERFDHAVEYLRRLGFVLERRRDITSNVLASCDEIAELRLNAYTSGSDAWARDFIGAPGSHYYEELRSRRWLYEIFRLRKQVPAHSPAASRP